MLSTVLLACVHLGVVPVSGGWRLDAVHAPVVEPGVDEAVRAAFLDALAARQAMGERPLKLTVTRADWVPAQRSGAVLVYDVVLVVRVEAGAVVREVSATRTVPDPQDAAGAVDVRAASFAALAREVAAQGVAMLVAAQ